MPANELILPITPDTLPQGICPATLQEMWNAFAAAGHVTFPSTFSGITRSASKPSDQTQAWLKLDSLGRPVRLYSFASGAWLSLHPTVPGTTIMWINAVPNFTTFDGGDANALSSLSGPMWQVAVDLANNPITAKFPIAVGTLPSGLVLNVGDTGGEEKHTITEAESVVQSSHQHAVARMRSDHFQLAFPTGGNAHAMPGYAPGGSGDVTPASQSDYSTFGATTLQTDTVSVPSTPTAMNNMPPYIAVYFLQRTARLFYAEV